MVQDGVPKTEDQHEYGTSSRQYPSMLQFESYCSYYKHGPFAPELRETSLTPPNSPNFCVKAAPQPNPIMYKCTLYTLSAHTQPDTITHPAPIYFPSLSLISAGAPYHPRRRTPFRLSTPTRAARSTPSAPSSRTCPPAPAGTRCRRRGTPAAPRSARGPGWDRAAACSGTGPRRRCRCRCRRR